MTKKSFYVTLLILVAVSIFSFWLGRNSIQVETVVDWLPGEPIPVPVPVNVYVEIPPPPAEVRWLYRDREVLVDNIITVVQEVDTLAIMADWTMIREFNSVVENDYGTLDITSIVQYNRLQDMNIIQTPNIKVITNTIRDPQRRFTVGLQVGYGVMQSGGNTHLGPYAGFGVGIRLW